MDKASPCASFDQSVQTKYFSQRRAWFWENYYKACEEEQIEKVFPTEEELKIVPWPCLQIIAF